MTVVLVDNHAEPTCSVRISMNVTRSFTSFLLKLAPTPFKNT